MTQYVVDPVEGYFNSLHKGQVLMIDDILPKSVSAVMLRIPGSSVFSACVHGDAAIGLRRSNVKHLKIIEKCELSGTAKAVVHINQN